MSSKPTAAATDTSWSSSPTKAGPWGTSVFWVNRDGDDPNTDGVNFEVNFEEPIYDCTLEQTLGVHAAPQPQRKTTTPPKTDQTPSRTFNFWTKRCRRFPTQS